MKLRQAAEYIIENAAVLIICHFDGGIEPGDCLETGLAAVGTYGGNRQFFSDGDIRGALVRFNRMPKSMRIIIKSI